MYKMHILFFISYVFDLFHHCYRNSTFFSGTFALTCLWHHNIKYCFGKTAMSVFMLIVSCWFWLQRKGLFAVRQTSCCQTWGQMLRDVHVSSDTMKNSADESALRFATQPFHDLVMQILKMLLSCCLREFSTSSALTHSWRMFFCFFF